MPEESLWQSRHLSSYRLQPRLSLCLSNRLLGSNMSDSIEKLLCLVAVFGQCHLRKSSRWLSMLLPNEWIVWANSSQTYTVFSATIEWRQTMRLRNMSGGAMCLSAWLVRRLLWKRYRRMQIESMLRTRHMLRTYSLATSVRSLEPFQQWCNRLSSRASVMSE